MPKTVKRAAKAGGAKEEAAKKRKLFIEAYIANGGNATEAAKTAGYSGKTAYSAGSRLLKDVEVQQALSTRRAVVIEKAELTTERVLREIARVAFSDARRYFRPDGTLKGFHELDDEAAGALSGIDVVETASLEGGELVPMYTKKVRMWDKNSALEKAMKHLGLFEEDNKQAGAAAARFIYVPQKGSRAR